MRVSIWWSDRATATSAAVWLLLGNVGPNHTGISATKRFTFHLSANDNMAEKEKPSVVAQDAIHIERIKKEEKLLKQHTKFHINPFRKC